MAAPLRNARAPALLRSRGSKPVVGIRRQHAPRAVQAHEEVLKASARQTVFGAAVLQRAQFDHLTQRGRQFGDAAQRAVTVP